MLSVAELPPPDAAAQAHSRRLVALIAAEIGAHSIGFARYMEQVLYAPGLGYYMAGQARFGAAGDFVTAPEISPAFARALAASAAAVLGELSGGDILELGAGSGALAAELLQALAARGALPRRYLLLEVSGALRAEQMRRLGALPRALADRVAWLGALPAQFQGVVVANEVADALPVSRFVIGDGEVLELRTGCRAGRLCDVPAPAGAALREAVDTLQSALGYAFPDGYRSELSPSLSPWLGALADCLQRGALLLIDYGYPRREYYLPERCDGTLVCHYRHRVHGDPYWYPGLQDISASVDFTAVADAATGAGLELEGYTTLAHYLVDAGALEQADELDAGSVAGIAARAGLHKLLLPGEMGERFAVMAFSRALAQPLPGLRARSLTHRL